MKYERLDWKYRLLESYEYLLPRKWHKATRHWSVSDHFFDCSPGRVEGKQGYAWDGPSGPTIDTGNTLRASLIHDILYQSIIDKKLPLKDRKLADHIFLGILKEDGVSLVRRYLWFWTVRLFGKRYMQRTRTTGVTE